MREDREWKLNEKNVLVIRVKNKLKYELKLIIITPFHIYFRKRETISILIFRWKLSKHFPLNVDEVKGSLLRIRLYMYSLLHIVYCTHNTHTIINKEQFPFIKIVLSLMM